MTKKQKKIQSKLESIVDYVEKQQYGGMDILGKCRFLPRVLSEYTEKDKKTKYIEIQLGVDAKKADSGIYEIVYFLIFTPYGCPSGVVKQIRKIDGKKVEKLLKIGQAVFAAVLDENYDLVMNETGKMFPPQERSNHESGALDSVVKAGKPAPKKNKGL